MSVSLKIMVLIFFSVIIFLVFQSCEMNNTDRAKYYKGNFIDEIFIVKESDTTNILIEQFQKSPFQKDSIS